MSPATAPLGTTSVGFTGRISSCPQGLVPTLVSPQGHPCPLWGHLGAHICPVWCPLGAPCHRPPYPVGHLQIWSLGPLCLSQGHLRTFWGPPPHALILWLVQTPPPRTVCTRRIKEENTDIYSGGGKMPPSTPPNPPNSPLRPHPGASLPADLVPCPQDGGGRTCSILGWLGIRASVSPSVVGLLTPPSHGVLGNGGHGVKRRTVVATLWGQGCGHQLQGTWDEAGGASDLHQSILPPASPRWRNVTSRATRSPLLSPDLSHRYWPALGMVGRVQNWPLHLPLQQERRWQGMMFHSRLVGSCPSSSAAFGDHLPVPLLLLHQPGGEQGGGLRDPPERDLLKVLGRGHLLAVADFGEFHESLLGCP